jgi:hypothetical protein
MSDKNAVFYFNFDIGDNAPSVWCGFIFNSTAIPEFEDMVDNGDFYDEVCSDIEDQFGVHDWSSSPAGIPAIGYTSYEIEDPAECMNTWLSKFIEMVGKSNVSKWVYFDYNNDDDLSIFNKIKSLV